MPERVHDDKVRRLTADVELLQAQVAGMDRAVTSLAEDLARLTGLMATAMEHVNELAALLAEERSRG